MRGNLADDIADRLRQLVADGELSAGARINEVAVSERLGVSRTPLREALSRLMREGFVESRPRRGFFVQELSAGSVRELYEMRAVLDPAALALAGVPPAATLHRLAELNDEIGDAAGDVEAVIDLDDAWHLTLVGACPNRIVLDLIRQFMQRTRPLERAYVRAHGSVSTMVAEHGRIAERLRRNDLEGAVARLRENMESGLGPILAWYTSGRPTPEQMRRS